MAKKVLPEYTAFFEGISDFNKTGGPASYQIGRNIDHRTDTRSITLNPKTTKESGSIVTDLIKWCVNPPTQPTIAYLYGSSGNFYKRENGVYTLLRTIPDSHGNGLAWFGEDNFIYYTSDKLIGRYGPLDSATPQFTDDYFGSQGGVRTNTQSLELLATSSQYASRLDTASLSLAGDLTLEAQIKPYTAPTGIDSMTLISKWDESTNERSYKLDIIPVSAAFGSGVDGALTISVNTTDAPIDSACFGSVGTTTLTATNAGFAADQIILIHQSQGTNAGQWERNQIQSYTAGTITLVNPLAGDYVTGAQVIVMNQYTNVTVNAGVTWTAKAWNGTTGGILTFLASGTVTVNGTITASQKGFRGHVQSSGQRGKQGEGSAGAGGTATSAANGNGGGGGNGGSNRDGSGGGGGGNATSGTNGVYENNDPANAGVGGAALGTTDLTTMAFGGGGGSGGTNENNTQTGGSGGNGGGIIFIEGNIFTIAGTGSVTSLGTNGGSLSPPNSNSGGGGGGAGGSVLIKSQVATLNTLKITATGGAGGTSPGGRHGGAGSTGRITVVYSSSYTGTTDPTFTAVLDSSLGETEGTAVRLQISNNGTTIESYFKNFTMTLNTWQDIAVTWDSTTSTATFYVNGVSVGTQTGSFTVIDDNSSDFAVGAYFDGGGSPAGFFDGLIDEVRVFSTVLSNSAIIIGLTTQINPSTSFLEAYYQFNNSPNDATINANNLTLQNSPDYSTDTPFFSPSARLDIDQQQTTAGQTYTLPTAIIESAIDELVFTPTLDPQKSIAVLVAAVGTGDWTITVHDSFNYTVATLTVPNASMNTGYYEFIFPTVWRPIINNNYHFHLTSTVADGTVTTGVLNDLSTVSYRTFYQFLVEDQAWHPISTMLNFLVFGNERYIAKLESTIYEANYIVLPAGWKVRCFGYWNEYLAVGAWRGVVITDFESGRIFFWDGVALTYNFFVDVPEGAVNAMVGTRNQLYFIVGYRGQLMIYEGGARARKIKNLLNTDNQFIIEIYPGAMSMWRALLRFGIAGYSTDTTIQRGVYTWGSINEKYPESLSMDYTISTGSFMGNNVTIGMVQAVNNKLLIGWQDGTAYGVDVVEWGTDVFAYGDINFLIEDDEMMFHEKEMVVVDAQFAPLLSGQTIQLQYKLNRNDTYTMLPIQNTPGATTDRHVISTDGSRYREFQVGIILTTTVPTGPQVFAISAERDMLESEKRVG